MSVLLGAQRSAIDFVRRRSHHDSRLFEDYVQTVSWEDTNVQQAMLVCNALASIGSSNEFVFHNGNWVKQAKSWTKFGVIASFALGQLFTPEKAHEAFQNYLASSKAEEQAGGLYGYAILHMGEVRPQAAWHAGRSGRRGRAGADAPGRHRQPGRDAGARRRAGARAALLGVDEPRGLRAAAAPGERRRGGGAAGRTTPSPASRRASRSAWCTAVGARGG